MGRHVHQAVFLQVLSLSHRTDLDKFREMVLLNPAILTLFQNTRPCLNTDSTALLVKGSILALRLPFFAH